MNYTMKYVRHRHYLTNRGVVLKNRGKSFHEEGNACKKSVRQNLCKNISGFVLCLKAVACTLYNNTTKLL